MAASAADRTAPDRSPAPAAHPAANLWTSAYQYTLDAWQRGILYTDVMRQRGNQYLTHMAKRAPNVLSMKSELVLDGRKFERPVNYALLRIVPPADARSTRRSTPSWWSTRAPGTAPASAASSPKAKSAWRCAPAIPATSPPSCRTRPTPRRSRT